MYADPEMTVSTLLSWARDGVIILSIVTFGWKVRGVFQDAKDFISAIRKHMLKMEHFAYRLEMNHLKHMELYLYKLAKDRNLITMVDPLFVESDDVPPPDNSDASTL